MISNQEEDEFVAVRVQDPRIQNEGSWNSYVDYKIFLHTNSKAFTAKTSCVRRRYSEFAWLKKKLQKNAGLVPVPDLPGKSFFSFSNEDFLEGRRKGLQAFLDKVVNMTVCLSDSQLHLFLQTQLPVGHIQDCVQGHTPYTVTDAILTYASSNRGFAQAQEDDSIKEPSLTVSYESMESPAPHQPSLQTKDTLSSDSDPLEGLLEVSDKDTVELHHKEKPSLKVLQKNNHLEAVFEDCGPTEASFFLGEGPDDSDQTQQRSCLIQTPVEVHSPMGTGFEVNSGVEESTLTLDAEEETVVHPDTEERADQQERSEEAILENNLNSVAILNLKDSDTGSQEDVLEDVCSEKQVLEDHVIECISGAEGHTADVSCPEQFENSDKQKETDNEQSVESESEEETPLESEDQEETHSLPQVGSCDNDPLEDVCSGNQVLENHVIEHVGGTDGHVTDLSCFEEFKNLDEQKEQDDQQSVKSEGKEETPLESEIMEETRSVPQVEGSDDDGTRQEDQMQAAQKEDLVGTKDESDEDSRSLPSSNGSIVKVSDEESVCDEAEDFIQAANGFLKTSPVEVALWSEVEASNRNILDLHMNGCSVEKDISTQEDEDLQYATEISEFGKSLDLNSTVAAGDLTENSDFSIIETSCSPGLADSKFTEPEAPSSLTLEAAEETHEVEAC
ncbi:sorting nexin-11 [Sparus aurata]|uniref:PX domain-containing protein n=1 Tax=Sparus aurata TaxID=8175 RepID=A0A671WUH3_SPAAU|nr:sorting nexin-11 [Sparus aurata]